MKSVSIYNVQWCLASDADDASLRMLNTEVVAKNKDEAIAMFRLDMSDHAHVFTCTKTKRAVPKWRVVYYPTPFRGRQPVPLQAHVQSYDGSVSTLINLFLRVHPQVAYSKGNPSEWAARFRVYEVRSRKPAPKPVPAPKPKPKPAATPVVYEEAKPKPVSAPRRKPIVYIDECPDWYEAPLHHEWWNFGPVSASDEAEERVFSLHDGWVEAIEGVRVDTMTCVYWVENATSTAAMILGASTVSGDTFAVRYEEGQWRMATFSGGQMKSESTFPSREEEDVIKAMLNV